MNATPPATKNASGSPALLTTRDYPPVSVLGADTPATKDADD